MKSNTYHKQNIFGNTPLWYFLDDEREPPIIANRYWIVFRNGESMLDYIAEYGLSDGISFDHDLGENVISGHDVAKALIEMLLDHEIVVPVEFSFVVHSVNPVGAKNIDATMSDFLMLHNTGA